MIGSTVASPQAGTPAPRCTDPAPRSGAPLSQRARGASSETGLSSGFVLSTFAS